MANLVENDHDAQLSNETYAEVFSPSTALVICETGGFSKQIKVFDLTSLHSNDLNNPAQIMTSISKSKNKYPSEPLFTIKRKNIAGTKWDLLNASGQTLASWESPILLFGSSKLTFPSDSPYASSFGKISPLGVTKRGVTFVMSSVPYTWESEGEREHFVLSKTLGGRKIQLGEYFQKHGYDQRGVLTVDNTLIDVPVAIIGCLALIKRWDSFAQ